jgi:20S proteasome alpha/beta subunit
MHPEITILSKENSIFEYNINLNISGLRPIGQYELWMFDPDGQSISCSLNYNLMMKDILFSSRK